MRCAHSPCRGREVCDEHTPTSRPGVPDYATQPGVQLQDTGTSLLDFVTFMEHHRASYITHSLALTWAKQPSGVQPDGWARRLSYVRMFARHRSATDPRTQIPPAGLLPYRPKRAQPYLYSDKEIEALLRAALKLPGNGGLRPWIYHCLLGLLSVSGLRLGEAQNLELRDVDLKAGVLTVRGAKFGKSRLVPLHASTRRVLADYIARRRECGRDDRSLPTCSCRAGVTDWMAATFTGRFTSCLGRSGYGVRPIVAGRACTICGITPRAGLFRAGGREDAGFG